MIKLRSVSAQTAAGGSVFLLGTQKAPVLTINWCGLFFVFFCHYGLQGDGQSVQFVGYQEAHQDAEIRLRSGSAVKLRGPYWAELSWSIHWSLVRSNLFDVVEVSLPTRGKDADMSLTILCPSTSAPLPISAYVLNQRAIWPSDRGTLAQNRAWVKWCQSSLVNMSDRERERESQRQLVWIFHTVLKSVKKFHPAQPQPKAYWHQSSPGNNVYTAHQWVPPDFIFYTQVINNLLLFLQSQWVV